MLLLVRTVVEAPNEGWGSAITIASFALVAALLATFVTIERRSAQPLVRLGPLVDRYGTARIITAGMVSLLAGYLLFLRLDDSPSYLGLMLPTMLLLGVGFALSFPALNIQAVAGVPDHEQGLASGLLNTSFQVGGAVGLAVVSAVVSSNTGASMLDAFQPAIAVSVGIAFIGALVAASALVVPVRDRLASAEG
jgi:MFS family permease